MTEQDVRGNEVSCLAYTLCVLMSAEAPRLRGEQSVPLTCITSITCIIVLHCCNV